MIESVFTRKISYIDASGDSYEIIAFTPTIGNQIEITVPSQDLTDPTKIYKKLLSKGLNHIEHPPIPHGLLEAINAEPLRRSIMVDKLGWVGRHFDVFASAAGIAGNDRGDDSRTWVIDSALMAPQEHAGARRDISDWFEGCAMPSYFSTAGNIALAAAFAGPLLHVISEPAFGIAFYGGSKLEADTIALIAGSVSGIDRQTDVPKVSHGDLYLEEWQARFSDQLVPIRLGGIGDGRKHIGMVSSFANFYAGESKEKRRRSITVSQPSATPPRLVAAIVASISKEEISHIIQALSKTRFNPRIILAPIADERFGFFDLDRRGRSKAESVSKIVEIRKSIVGRGSIALHDFAKFLIERSDNLKSRVEELVQEFEASADKSAYEDEMSFSSSRCFGLLYAAAILAGEAQLLLQDPTPDGREVTKALFIEAHRKSLALRGIPRPPKVDVLELLKEWESTGRLVAYNSGAPIESFAAKYGRGGYWVEEGNYRIYTIHQSPLRSELGDRRLALILRFLKEKNSIKTGVEPTGNIFHDCGSTPRWPGGEMKVKSYVFKVPKKLLLL